MDNHVKNKKYGNFVSISSPTVEECTAEKFKHFCSSSLWTCLHHMVILRSQNKITDFLMILAWASPFQWKYPKKRMYNYLQKPYTPSCRKKLISSFTWLHTQSVSAVSSADIWLAQWWPDVRDIVPLMTRRWAIVVSFRWAQLCAGTLITQRYDKSDIIPKPTL